MEKTIVITLLIISINAFKANAQNETKKLKNLIDKTQISGQWFLAYTYNSFDSLSHFQLKRGYLDIKTKINKTFLVRYTQDITIDKEGDDAGNIETRMKYMYLRTKLPGFAFITQTYLEAGMAHRPWVDFDGKINTYRLQDEMFTDRTNIINSADLGLLWAGLLGEPLDDDYQNSVSNVYPGQYGSFSLGIFNGGGYSALEQNSNKTIETRLTLRPFPETIPGLQFTHSLAYGLANTPATNALFLLNMLAVSSQSRYHILHAQLYKGKGGYQEHFVSPRGISYKNKGFSILGEIKIPQTKLAVFSRYDYLKSEKWLNQAETLAAAGIAYRFQKSKIAAYFEKNNYINRNEIIAEIALEIKF